MGVLDFLGGPLAPVIDIVGKVIDRVIPDPAAAAEAKLKLATLEQNGELTAMLAQTDTNKVEAASDSVFVAGWRPSVGWVCSGALAFQFIIAPTIQWGMALYGKDVVLPPLDTGTLIALLMSMLGVGGMRTIEKLNGVASSGISK